MTKKEKALIEIDILMRAIEKDLERDDLTEQESKNLRRMIRLLRVKKKEIENS